MRPRDLSRLSFEARMLRGTRFVLGTSTVISFIVCLGGMRISTRAFSFWTILIEWSRSRNGWPRTVWARS